MKECPVFGLYRASRLLTRVYNKHLKGINLSYPQYLVLQILSEKKRLHVDEIGEMMLLDSGTLSPLLKKLESAGYVTRLPDTQDERKKNITLTPQGLSLSARFDVIRENIKKEFSLNQGDLSELLRILNLILAAEKERKK